MDLAALSAKYGDFYAPGFFISVGGDDLVGELLVPVSQVEVDLVLDGAGRFSFTVVDTYSFEKQSFLSGHGSPVLALLDFGARVEIRMGYGTTRKMPVILRGMITAVSASFPQGGAPELSISGYDNVFPLTIGKSSETWANDHDSSVVQQIAGQRHLAVEVTQTKEARPQIEQNQESDFEFIRKLAQRNYYKVYVDEGDKASVLRFTPPNDKGGPVVRLVWGAGLLGFRPSANLAGQVGAAEVYGWDPKKADRFLGQAGRGDLTDLAGNQRSAGELLARIVGEKQPTLRIRQPVYSESEANTRAQAALNENEEEFLTGDGESIGLPEIRPDQNLELAGLGTPFSRIWYVEQATHRIDSGGYRTSFRVKHKLIPASKK